MLAVVEDPHQLREGGCTHTFLQGLCLEQTLGMEGAARCPVCRAPAGAGARATLVTRAVDRGDGGDDREPRGALPARRAAASRGRTGGGADAAWELRADEGRDLRSKNN